MGRMVRISLMAMLLALASASIAAANVPWAPHRVMVMVFPTERPGHRYELAIGSAAFEVRSGRRGFSAMVMSDASQEVTLRTVPGCRLIAHLSARSGHLYAIELLSPTDASVSEAFGDTETPLPVEAHARCVLPPTDALATSTPPTPMPLGPPILSMAGLVGFAIALRGIRYRSRRPGQPQVVGRPTPR